MPRIYWKSNEIDSLAECTRHLSIEEKRGLTKLLACMDPSYSSLPKELISLYEEINYHVFSQKGFIVIKDFIEKDKISQVARSKQLLYKFCKNLGVVLTQNKNQDTIFDVKSVSNRTMAMHNSRGPYVQDNLPMHTDAGSILGMLCLNSVGSGGDTLLACAEVVHDTIENLYPDLLNIYYEPFYTDRRGEELPGSLPYDKSPIFIKRNDELACQYHEPFHTDAQLKFPQIPRLTLKQQQALKIFNEIALKKEIVYQVKLQSNDLIFINNEKILHGRTHFRQAANEKPRHLLRIWVNSPLVKNAFHNFLGYPEKAMESGQK